MTRRCTEPQGKWIQSEPSQLKVKNDRNELRPKEGANCPTGTGADLDVVLPGAVVVVVWLTTISTSDNTDARNGDKVNVLDWGFMHGHLRVGRLVSAGTAHRGKYGKPASKAVCIRITLNSLDALNSTRRCGDDEAQEGNDREKSKHELLHLGSAVFDNFLDSAKCGFLDEEMTVGPNERKERDNARNELKRSRGEKE